VLGLQEVDAEDPLEIHDHHQLLVVRGIARGGARPGGRLRQVFNFDPGALVKQRTAETCGSDDRRPQAVYPQAKLLRSPTLCTEHSRAPASRGTGQGPRTGHSHGHVARHGAASLLLVGLWNAWRQRPVHLGGRGGKQKTHLSSRDETQSEGKA
ncbi:hypothetical protein CRUP_020614, partial [Coryphaenoides rupestris]